jgi:hypothetical protein
MPIAIERIVVQATPGDKKAIAAKARKLSLPISELMRRGAFAYNSAPADEALLALADAARTAADRAGASIDEALDFIAASDKRIAAMEAKAAKAANALKTSVSVNATAPRRSRAPLRKAA